MKKLWLILLTLFLAFGIAYLPGAANAAPVVKTVPWVASNPLIPHDTWTGKIIRLKGTVSETDAGTLTYTWDFGDGSPVATGTVTNRYAIEASHAYTGTTGTIFTARLTVRNTSTDETGSKEYYVKMEERSLQVEVNVAIDEGLWYLHKIMNRTGNQGYWGGYGAVTPANLNAFFVNGHLETGADSNPYTETVQRGMRYLFTQLSVGPTSLQAYPAPIGPVNPDGNGNGLYISSDDTYPYSGGIYMDAIVASGTPNAITTTGTANVIGRSYKDIVQDMVDGYAFGQTDTGTWMGGWGYGWNYGSSDNSVNQWAAIGLLGAESWGITVPAFVKQANMNSLNNTQATTANCNAFYDGAFAYTNNYCYFPWGPYGTTPAGMVQMVLDGIGRGNAQWDRTEDFIRRNFCNTGASYDAIKSYYYGLFSFTKAMLLTPGGGIQFLTNRPSGLNPIDWYAAEASAGAQCNGVARTLVNDQQPDGHWLLHNYYGYHDDFSTGWAIIMLNRTVFESGVPVAVAKAVPNPGIVGQTINFSGGTSFHQDPTKHIASWDWDLDNNGTFETPGLTASRTFPALGNYLVTLRVTDDSTPAKTNTNTVTVQITTPPIAPTAEAGGPYNFCMNRTPWFLDGTGSVNADEGQHEFGAPPNTIIEYSWDLPGGLSFGDAFGPTPDVTAYFTALGPGSYNIQLRVTDNTAASYPSSGMGNLSNIDSAQVYLRAATAPECGSCPTNLVARPKPGKADLTWTWRAGAHHYNVYRSTVTGGPYGYIGTVSSAGLPNTGVYADFGLTNGTPHYWIVREAANNNAELCQSNQATATPTARVR